MIVFRSRIPRRTEPGRPAPGELEDQVREIISGLPASTLRERRPGDGPLLVRRLRIGQDRFRLVVDLMRTSGTDDLVPVATVERVPPPELSAESLRRRFHLTARETLVALLLARRRSNIEIANALEISPHTARRHTENVMLKMNVTSRFSVESALRPVA